jgi:hypothetical protein
VCVCVCQSDRDGDESIDDEMGAGERELSAITDERERVSASQRVSQSAKGAASMGQRQVCVCGLCRVSALR